MPPSSVEAKTSKLVCVQGVLFFFIIYFLIMKKKKTNKFLKNKKQETQFRIHVCILAVNSYD